MTEDQRNTMFTKLYGILCEQYPHMTKRELFRAFMREALYGLPIGAVPLDCEMVAHEEIDSFQSKISR